MNQPRHPIRAGVEMFPYGQYQGVPVITLDIHADPASLPSKDMVFEHLLKAQRTGTNALWIREAPWSQRWDEIVWEMISSNWLGVMPFLAIRDIGEEVWSNHQVQWIADCTALVDFDAKDVAPIEKRCDAMGFRPSMQEVIVREIHPAQFNSATLDGLARSMRVEQSWLYLENDQYWANQKEIEQAVSSCATAWGARPWVTKHHKRPPAEEPNG